MMYTMPRFSPGQTTFGAHTMEREVALGVRRPRSSEQDASVRRELYDDNASRFEVVQLHILHANGLAVAIVLVWMSHIAFL